jgi:hypothetical protein
MAFPLSRRPSRDRALLVFDVFGHVGERPQALPQRQGPADEQRGQRSADQEDRPGLPESYGLHPGHDSPDDDQRDAEDSEGDMAFAPLRLRPSRAGVAGRARRDELVRLCGQLLLPACVAVPLRSPWTSSQPDTPYWKVIRHPGSSRSAWRAHRRPSRKAR